MTRFGRGAPMSRRSLLRAGLALGAGAAVAPLAACAGPVGAASPGSLTLGLNRSLVSLDNKLNQFDAAVTVQRGVRQALTRIDRNMTARLILAERFEQTAPTQWTVRLRQEAHYSDGSPVVSADVATALEMYSQVNGSFLVGLFPELPGRPEPILDLLMSNILITPAAANKPEELSDGLGSGPYIVTSANGGTGEYTLERNRNYWGTPSPVRTVRVRFVPDESSRVISIRSGELDVIDSITPDSADQLTSLPGVVLERSTGTRINQLFFNFRKPQGHPLADARVREALTYAIDGKALVDDVLVGSAKQAEGIVPLALSGAVKTGTYTYDPRRSRALLDSLNVSDLKLKIIWESGEFPADASVMEAVAEMLRDVGVTAELQQFEPGGNILQWRQGRGGDWDVLGNGYPGPTGQAITSLLGMFGGTPEKERARDTYQGYVMPAIAEGLATAGAEIDADRRTKLLTAVQQSIWDTWPCMWAFVPNVVLARRTRVQGIQLEPINSYDLDTVRVED
jgi:peptide/nickel transport system substrate-binding protein